MGKNKIIIRQNLYKTSSGQLNNEYHFWTENGIYLGGILLPSNNQYMFDDKCLDIITKALAIRWGLIQAKSVK